MQFIIEAVPVVSSENVIREYSPTFNKAFSINIDQNDNIYIQTNKCTLCYSADWNYKYSYIHKNSSMSRRKLSVTDQALIYTDSMSYSQLIISFDGSLTENTLDTYPLNEHHNNSITTSEKATFRLKTFLFFSKIVDNTNNVYWHSSYIGGWLVICLYFGIIMLISTALAYVVISTGKLRTILWS